MAETDVLNPTAGWDPELGDSMNPSYGFVRKRSATLAVKKAVGGSPWTREIGNTGHTFVLSWLGRTLGCVERLKWFYEMFEDGFFTFRDWEAGGRCYTGRFTTEIQATPTAANSWDVQNVTFEEIPTAPMLVYPNDWNKWGVRRYVANDWGDQKVAATGTWAQTQRVINGTARASLDSAGTNAGDWAQYEYRGYGFRLWLIAGPAQGQSDVYLDGTLLQMVDCYSAAGPTPQMIYHKENVPLDLHRVKVIVKNTKNAASTAPAIGWWMLEVMR